MNNIINNNDTSELYDEIDLNEIFQIIWNKKFFIISFTFIVAVVSVIIALKQPNVYTSKALLAPAASENSLSSKLGALSSIASLGGFSLPSASNSKDSEAIERIKSYEFFSNYFLPNIKLENMFAIKNWDLSNDGLIYDDKIFDSKTSQWKKSEPSTQLAYEKYLKVIHINRDPKTTFITISVSHNSPVIAKKWVEIIISKINESMRKIDANDAQNSISFLNERAQTTNVQSLKVAISQLLEHQMQILMLSSSQKYYVLKVIDSPIIPERHSKPSRSLIAIIGTTLGMVLSLVIVFVRHYLRPVQS
jgi:uncharacterized protein involved in exopolysaccharide biosynthesis